MKSSFLPKYEQKNVKLSALTTQGRNPDNFLFVFWEKWWVHKFILKSTDLYLNRTTTPALIQRYWAMLVHFLKCSGYNKKNLFFFTGLHTITAIPVIIATLITGPQLMPTQENPSPLCTTLPCHTQATIKPCLTNYPWTFPSFLERHSNFKIPNFNKIFLLSPDKNKVLT